jgi:hypothetical protein
MTNHASPTYAAFAADIKKTYSHEYIAAQHALGVKVRHYREWDKTDLLALYDSFFGRQVFIHLARLMGEAQHEAALRTGASYDSLAPAQAALSSITPTGLDWQGFTGVMAEAVTEIKERSRRMTNDLATLFAEGEEPQQTDMPAGQFDQQAALAAMEAHMATVGSQHTTEASPSRNEVVSGLRSLFTRAAS